MTRLTATISGHVQGVGFRFTTQRIARAFAVTGYVQNLHDGRVLIVAEGERHDIDTFLGTVRNRMTGCIEDIDTQYTDPTGQFDKEGFGIRK